MPQKKRRKEKGEGIKSGIRIYPLSFILYPFLCALLFGAHPNETTLIVPPFESDFGFHRASKFYLDMYLGQNFRFDDPEGLAADKLAVEDDPTTSADDQVLTLFGVNSGSGQIVYNIGMKKLAVWPQSAGRRTNLNEHGQLAGDTVPNRVPNNQLNHPHGVAVNRAGDVYVADTDNDRVVHLRYLTTGLTFVRAIPGFHHPYGVAVDSRGQVYVTDTENSEVVVLDSSDRVKARWPGFVQPTGIAAIDRGSRNNFYAETFVVVIDDHGRRLSRLSQYGEMQASIEARDIGLAKAEFAYCALDCYSSVYVTDRLNDQVHKFDRNLAYLASCGRTGSSEGEFVSPRGIAIGRQFGQVFIAEAEGGQYYWTGVDGYFIGCYPPAMTRDQPGTTIAIYATDMAEVTIDVYDKKDKVIRNLYSALNRDKAGELLVVWDGKDNVGKPVPPGDYRVTATLKPTYGGARRYVKKVLTGKVKRI